ncbi:MAG: alpha/beta fold hydrolase [Gammaproteobacteria bacterium]
MPVNLNYQIYGAGAPLFILHGLFGSGRNWNSIARQLSNSNQVVTVDLRNHGDSEHADSMTYTEMAEDIVRLATDLGHDSFKLVGHSMGGKTAMTAALLYPEKVGSLVIVDIAPVSYPSSHDELITALQSLPLTTLTSRNQADQMLAEQIDNPTLRQFLLQNLVRDKDGYKWRINLDAIQTNHSLLRDFPAELQGGHYAGPMLLLSGGQSDYIQSEHQPIITGFFPNTDHRIIRDANHWVHADKPDRVIEEIRAFLE